MFHGPSKPWIFIARPDRLRARPSLASGEPQPANIQQQVLDSRTGLQGLTRKQRQVLDLLIEHKTSKEIARRLSISPHTVDQRTQFAKD